MDATQSIQWLAAALVVLKSSAEFFLNRLNASYVRERAGKMPPVFEGMIAEGAYAQSVDYTLAKNRLDQFSNPCGLLLLLAALFSGFLPWSHGVFSTFAGESAWAKGAWIISIAFLFSATEWPWEWYRQFRLEERFDFNKTTLRLWISDRIKGAALAILLGVPMLALLLWLVEAVGNRWWLYGWGTAISFQIAMMFVVPKWILPWFNRFEPLAEGELRERLLRLGKASGFSVSSIQVMDGSKRLAHSNAFFAGFGRFRKIVLFDTLVQQLSAAELEAVLAHEIGHYKKKHLWKLLAWSCLALLVGFWALAQLMNFPPFLAAFGFAAGSLAPAFLLFGLLSGSVSFWITPLSSAWSRKFEYQADAFAAQAIENASGAGSSTLISALRKLAEKNLSNLTPHPLYSRFYYSHPTLLEREQALQKFIQKN